jgi:CRISPR-associated protein Cmr2
MKSPTYWQDKISVWLHDPVCKAFDIQHHEAIAKEIADTLFQTEPEKETYQAADMIASGMTRAALPGYHTDPLQNGAVNFTDSPCITHPLVSKTLPLTLPKVDVEKLVAEYKRLLSDDLGLEKSYEEMRNMPEDKRPLNGFFDRNTVPEKWAETLYHYLFFALKRRLRNQDTGGLGALWDILPADTRMPDHPIWHHLGLVSALYSSMMSSPSKGAAMFVFSISPVQGFIANARKLRDYWTGSVLLSYLAFTGLKTVMEDYGPDHVLYPSLHNQSLVNAWLKTEFHLGRYLIERNEDLKETESKSVSIAAFPNKFMALCPKEDAAAFCKTLETKIHNEWIRQAGFVREYLAGKTNAGSRFAALWSHQVDDYWNYSWSTVPLLSLDDVDSLKLLLQKEKWEREFDTVSAFAEVYETKLGTGKAAARLYGAAHSLAQGLVAAGKMKPSKLKLVQEGEKCPLCGEHEALHNMGNPGETSAHEYQEAVTQFWNRVREKTNPANSYAQTGEHERLCAVCSVKRYLPLAIKSHPGELLWNVLQSEENFPSTTEVAATDYISKLKKVNPLNEKFDEKKLSDMLRGNELGVSVDDEHDGGVQALVREGRERGVSYTNKDKYYALLLMDGDKMGDLINGTSIAARWKDVIHPELSKRFENQQFCPDSPFGGKNKKVSLEDTRLMNPALHGMISDSLNNFARYGVNPAVLRGNGRLIYAGGDDVCAIVPVSTAIETADAIRKAYTLCFAAYTKEGAVEFTGDYAGGAVKIGLHLGKAGKISISAAIVIAHHKQALREVIRNAHEVLENIAKKRAGRNALAVRLSKRSGGDRDLCFKWEEAQDTSRLRSFQRIMRAVQEEKLSPSLLYRIGDKGMAILLAPLLEKKGGKGKKEEDEAVREKIIALFRYEVKHSNQQKEELSDDEIEELAQALAGICISEGSAQSNQFNQEAAIIAAFLASAIEG